MLEFDMIIKEAGAIRGNADPDAVDIAVKDGKIAALEAGIDPARAANIVDAQGLIAFPGVVDAHQHWGIYNPLAQDAETESRAALTGGVTTGITYMRTGQYYLGKSGPYATFFPEVLELTSGNAHIDYAFHLAPMMSQHISEVSDIIEDFGVTSFKIFMFYGSHGLHGRSDDQSSFLMTPPGERYDIAHFEFVMRAVQSAREKFPHLAESISLSLHCETAEIMAAYTKLVEGGPLTGLEAYSASRPPHSEGLAITTASYLAHETALPNINLLHLSSEKAMDAALRMQQAFPQVNFRREVTIGHLLADINTASGIGGKVNPPLRPRSDVEALWRHVLAGEVDWVVSDHACCRHEMKFGEPEDDVFVAKSGFGGAEYLLPGLISEGRRRGLDYGKIARMLSTNPAERYGLNTKGRLEVGYDADIALVNPDRTWTVRAADSPSTQEYTPFEGFELTASVEHVFVRGHHALVNGHVAGSPQGRYVSRFTPEVG